MYEFCKGRRTPKRTYTERRIKRIKKGQAEGGSGESGRKKRHAQAGWAS